MVQKNLKNKLISLTIKQGKKGLSEKKLITFFKLFQKKNKKDYNSMVKKALMILTPVMHLRKVTRNTSKTFREYPYVLSPSKRILTSLKTFVKIPGILEVVSLEDFANKIQEKSYMKNSLQIRAIQQKKFLKYRWFI